MTGAIVKNQNEQFCFIILFATNLFEENKVLQRVNKVFNLIKNNKYFNYILKQFIHYRHFCENQLIYILSFAM